MMKKLIRITTLFMIVPILGFCQNRISIGINFKTEMNFLNVENELPQDRASTFGYTVGVQTHYEIDENLFFRSSFNFSYNKYTTTLMLHWPSGGSSPTKYDTTVKSIGIPIDLGYRIKSKKETIHFLLGINGLVNLNLNNITQIRGLGVLTTSNSQVNRIGNTMGLFVGLEKQIKDSMILGLEPSFSYGSNIFSNNNLKSDRIKFGITLRFRQK